MAISDTASPSRRCRFAQRARFAKPRPYDNYGEDYQLPKLGEPTSIRCEGPTGIYRDCRKENITNSSTAAEMERAIITHSKRRSHIRQSTAKPTTEGKEEALKAS
ncbi:hypothetical protein K443DRAFT_9195 [Laccaria amethystina LaAM-08-1]|uniref:Unplaced genomic scaffold K443scaffold_135, whole genome shotgun sequence n=1 Tax=Laccaria amethystina LaAM-08-1 TaxID=1095629 RepID=A0A0C9XQT5_9AGAR|nr:hypothetical protein K443DRAFT_9195 [Laccaria amethystina LaAM-08-1]